jgi:hypothetical protein
MARPEQSPHATRDAAKPPSSRWVLGGLLLVFFGPLFGALGLYFFADDLMSARGTTHHGALYEPAQPLEPFALDAINGDQLRLADLRGPWSLLHVFESPCGRICRQALYTTRQVRWALNEDQVRVQRVALLLETDASSSSRAEARGSSSTGRDRAGGEGLPPVDPTSHPELRRFRLALAAAGPLLGQLDHGPASESPESTIGYLFLIDPLGNLVLRYGPGTAGENVLEDLEHLLELSRIG